MAQRQVEPWSLRPRRDHIDGVTGLASASLADDSSVVEVAETLQAPDSRDHRAQPWDFDGPSLGDVAELRPRLDGLLRPGFAVETVRQARAVDATSDSDVFLETLASCAHASPGADRIRRAASSGDPACEESLGGTCSASSNRASRASRIGSLRFRTMFVFPVCHLFPLVVSQYLVPVD